MEITYLKWRERIEEITPQDHRLGDDLLLIDNADIRIAGNAVSCEPFKMDMSMAVIYEKGWARMKINMKEYMVEAPAALIVMYGQIYEPICHSEDIQTRVILMSHAFSSGLFMNFAETYPLYSLFAKNPIMTLDNDKEVFIQYFAMLLNLTRSSLTDFKLEAARHLTLAMFYGYSRKKHDFGTQTLMSTRKEEIYTGFLNLLGENYRKNREIGFYADSLCVTPKYLSQVVKAASGRTALDYIEEYVVSDAKAQLRSTTDSVQQISDSLNFPSQSVFGKYFKRITGMSPKEYRGRK